MMIEIRLILYIASAFASVIICYQLVSVKNKLARLPSLLMAAWAFNFVVNAILSAYLSLSIPFPVWSGILQTVNAAILSVLSWALLVSLSK